MNALAVIIPSKLASNLGPCLEAVRQNQPDAEIIVIDDGLDEDWLLSSHGNMAIPRIMGPKPFSFPRNVNLGIQAAAGADCIVLNDDAILETPGGFALLQRAAADHPEYGVIAATTNVAGNPHQQPRGIGLRVTDRALAFVCVLLPRRTIDRVGLMDERFGGLTENGELIYGHCDTDMCRRIRMAGLAVGVHDGAFVDHASLQSCFRGDARASGDIGVSRAIYMAKWGDLA